MEINAKKGTKVLFTGKGGYDDDNKYANKYLKIGQIYVVDFIRIYNWTTDVTLIGFPEKKFNSVHFDDIVETNDEIIESLENKMPVLEMDKHGFENYQDYVDHLLTYIERLKKDHATELGMLNIAMNKDKEIIKNYNEWVKKQPFWKD